MVMVFVDVSVLSSLLTKSYRQLLDSYLIANPVLPLDPHCLVETGNWPAAKAFFDVLAFFVVHLLAGQCFAVKWALLEQFVDLEPDVRQLIEPEMLQFWTTRHSPRRFNALPGQRAFGSSQNKFPVVDI
ncbi:hypothetical protein CPB83DRAFT_840886 [Crepidotus variabilis]|uniref:Uncharacterized protein n=1 Tax=Crepidotus variabilis TaxID=179855 RepID=A0A9P6E3L1_9AGAR|nr:hypothetical protein CPB83DRAFT_840886 [Crepidotus variabilis]